MTPAEEIKLDKELRQHLDMQLQILKNSSKSRERSLSITKLQECIMWLGMDLKCINESLPVEEQKPSPYPQSYNPESPVVEKTADGLKL